MAGQSDADAPEGEVALELKRAIMAYNKGRFYEVESILYKVIWTMHANPDEHLQARTLLGNALRRMGRTSEAEKELRKAMELSKAQGKGATKAEVLLAMAKVHFRKGDLTIAEELTKDGHLAAKEVGNAALAGKALMDQAGIYVMRGNYEAAEPKLQEAIKLFQVAGTRSEVVRALHNLGYVYFHKEDLDKAVKTLQRAIELFDQTVEVTLFITIYSDLAQTYLRQGELGKADEFLRKAWEFLDRTDDKQSRLNVMWVQGLLLDAKGDPKGGVTIFEDVVKAFEEMGAKSQVVEISLDYIHTMLRAGNVKRATEALEWAKTLSEGRFKEHYAGRIAEAERAVSRARNEKAA